MSGDNIHGLGKQSAGDAHTPAQMLAEALQHPSVAEDASQKTVGTKDATICRTGTLYEMSKTDMQKTGMAPSNDDVYIHLNDIMKSSGFESANLDGKHNISDKLLPKSWNSISADECFIKKD